MKILLDTSAYVGFKRNQDELVDIIVNSELVLISPVVLGELMFGFRSGSRFKKKLYSLSTIHSPNSCIKSHSEANFGLG